MRVGFNLIESAKWTGGYNYLLNLFRTIQIYGADQICPVLFCGADADENDLRFFREIGCVEIVPSYFFNKRQKTVRALQAFLLGIDHNALQLFRQHRIDVIFENATFYGWWCPLPVVAWLPDFQHCYFRSQFGLGAYWRRELGFRAQVASGRMIMLSSETARKDCEQFYRGAIGNTRVVRFSACISTNLIEEFPENVMREYQLPPTFFYLPNQLWRHKNHMVVIEALSLLKSQGVEVVVAVTGNPLDPRHPGYAREINARIESLGLRNNYCVLGLVPRQHVISLLRICTAMVNPSLFEGWSSSVEEACALGVPMLLSDIAAHREQMKSGAIFFDASNVKDLAAKLRKMALAVSPVPLARTLDPMGSEKLRWFARDFTRVCEQARVHFLGR